MLPWFGASMVLIAPFLAAQLSNAVLAAQAFQHDADLLFSDMALARLFPIDATYAQESDRTFSERLLKQSAAAVATRREGTARQDQYLKCKSVLTVEGQHAQ
jgi:hypothetical protein